MQSKLKIKFLIYFLSFIVVLVSFFPIVWLLFTSLMPAKDIYAWPPKLFPSPGTFNNYVTIFNNSPELLRYILNSTIIAIFTTVTIILFGGLAAYALVRIKFRGSFAIMLGMLGVSMFPNIAILPAIFMVFKKLNLINSYPSLIIAHTGLFITMAIWILANYIRTIPFEIEDAAKIDGCGPFGIFWRIILPLSKPGIFATGLIVFIFSWNEFPLSLVLLHDNDMRTAPVGISLYPGEYSFPWETISTATFLSIIPVLIITGIFQKQIIGGLTSGSNR